VDSVARAVPLGMGESIANLSGSGYAIRFGQEMVRFDFDQMDDADEISRFTRNDGFEFAVIPNEVR
jgi:hypothetical protein